MVDMDPLIADTQTVDQDPTVVHMALGPVDLTADITLAVAPTDQDPTQGFLQGFWEEDLKQKKMIP